MSRRRGTSLIELMIMLVIVGAMLAIALPPTATALDRAAVRAASRDVETLFAAARDDALARGTSVWVVLDSTADAVGLRVQGHGTRLRRLGSIYGIALHFTRDSMSYDARGLGRGAANLTVVVTRGRASDSLVVSRLGRVRR
jgi:type II secretory pathway pseudopilin PulG